MKILITISLLFVFTLVTAQENKKINTETITIRKENQINQNVVYYKIYSGVASMSKKEILEMDTLTVGPKALKNAAVITSFDVSLIVKGVLHIVISKGNVLSKEVKTLLQQINSGNKIFIENVTAINVDGTINPVVGMTIKVK